MKFKNQTLLLFVVLSISGSYAFRPSLKNSSHFRSLPITQDSFGNNYISVSFEGLSSNETDQDSTGKMAINLYSNETFVAKCPSFTEFPDSRFDSSIQSGESKQVQYLYQGMEVSGYPVRLDLKSPAFYALNTPVLLATECNAMKGEVNGHMGLGNGDNFLTQISKSFAVFLSDGKDGLDSAFYFGNKTYITPLHSKKDGFTSSIQAGKNWAMTMSDIRVDIDESYSANLNLTQKYNVIFDINTPVIGVPVHLYRFITKVLEGFNVFCSEQGAITTCRFKKVNFDTLPTFNLVMDGNTTSENVIPLTPELYLNKDNKTLLLKSLSSDNYGAMSVNPEHADSIVLGASFMKHYFVQFETARHNQSSFVTINEAEHNPGLDQSDVLLIVMIILVSYILIMVIGYVVYLFKFKEDDPVEETVKENKEGEVVLKIDTPLLGNEEMTEVKATKRSFNEERRTAVNSIAE